MWLRPTFNAKVCICASAHGRSCLNNLQLAQALILGIFFGHGLSGPNALRLGATMACAVPMPEGWVLPWPEQSLCPVAGCLGNGA